MSRTETLLHELNQHQPDHVFRSRVQTSYGTVEDVLCKVYLPKRLEDRPYLVFRPSEQHHAILGAAFEFCVAGEIKNGSRKITFNAKKVYSGGLVSTQWASDIKEYRWLVNQEI